jgi:hypothetical protein
VTKFTVKTKLELFASQFFFIGGSVGSYSDSPGLEVIRRHVAEYIAQRYTNYTNYRNQSDFRKCRLLTRIPFMKQSFVVVGVVSQCVDSPIA